jgi:hypothetical protein
MYQLDVNTIGNTFLASLTNPSVPCVTSVVIRAGSVNTMELWEIIYGNVSVRHNHQAVQIVEYV